MIHRTRDEIEMKIRKVLSDMIDVFMERDNMKDMVSRLSDRNVVLEEENRKLKYEYEDSKLNRDNPLPYKWELEEHTVERRLLMFCPKCEMRISNLQNYCHACGQKIGKGFPLPDAARDFLEWK